jgi:hypothetical protein
MSTLAAHCLGEFKGVVDGQTVDSFLQEKPNPDQTYGQFGLLCPSIRNIAVDEMRNEFRIFGLFGTRPDKEELASVTVGGVPAHIDNWVLRSPDAGGGDEIDVKIPAVDSAGDIIVNIYGHKSNPGRVTYWQGTFSEAIPGSAPSATKNSLFSNITYHVSFRADIRQFRAQIDQYPLVEPTAVIEPIIGQAPLAPHPASYGSYNNGGEAEIVDNGNVEYWVTWTGTGDLDAYFGTEPYLPPNAFTMVGDFASPTTASLIFNLSGYYITASSSTNPTPHGAQVCPWGVSVALTLDNATISGGNRVSVAFGPCDTSKLGFKWGGIPPVVDTAPDPKSAR